MTYYEKVLTYTLYPNNLTDPHRSFSPDITLKDFTRKIGWFNLKDARTIKYVNPRGTSIILKDKNGVKQ